MSADEANYLGFQDIIETITTETLGFLHVFDSKSYQVPLNTESLCSITVKGSESEQITIYIKTFYLNQNDCIV